MSLLQRYLPRHDFAETHHITIAAPPAAVLDAVARADLSDDPLVRTLLQLRGLPLRLRQCLGASPAPAQDVWGGFGLHRFTPLGRDGHREIAWGLAGRFWEASGGLVSLPGAEAFERFSQPGHAKLVMTYIAEPQPDGRTRLTTITRVACPDAATRRRFAPYWYLIRPASGFIRGRALRRIKAMMGA